ncbi:carboxypeptidase regulatory-like domain-containing protein [Acinetobacter sp. YH12039]|uniref:carboxypeptidase regulatory-like domain-containing protein n=1 Tax=Acinetobacter sp. YH12039 TaxID=2601047 RepID=UPI0015D2732F|nr:carboxypeptidase regulatory-like domain-containing protein [Acinetobacter sp. YH12039]
MYQINRRFVGGYTPDPEVLQAWNVQHKGVRFSKPMSLQTEVVHGIGRIEGMVRSGGLPCGNMSVQVFKRDNKTLLWETKTTTDGVFKFRNIAVGLECYVMVFDPNREKNAKVKDLIVAR